MNRTMGTLLTGLILLCSFVGCQSEADRLEQEKSELFETEMAGLLSFETMSALSELETSAQRLASVSTGLPERDEFLEDASTAIALIRGMKGQFDRRELEALAAAALEGLVLCNNASATAHERVNSILSLDSVTPESLSSGQAEIAVREGSIYGDWGVLFLGLSISHRMALDLLMTSGPRDVRLSTFRLAAGSVARMKPVEFLGGHRLEGITESLILACDQEHHEQNKSVMTAELARLGIARTAD